MMDRLGVILLNLGGPGSAAEVAPFLRALFSDREIIRLPGGPLLQPLLARLITRLRRRSVIANYARIGGGSPILDLTRAQASGLAQILGDRGVDGLVTIAMRYTRPSAADALADLEEADRLVALTLYPHYSKATTGSSLADLERARQAIGDDRPLTVIDRYPTHEGYVESVAMKIRAGLEDYPEDRRDGVVLLFSAHSLPRRFIDDGDPYLVETMRCVNAVLDRLGGERRFKLAFQSRSGPVEWLDPDTEIVIEEMAEAGERDVLVVPISFVSDHIETLYEIDLLYGKKARSLGIDGWRRAESLNDSPAFLDALADLVIGALGKAVE
ncbi:MAG: ferrochelatase [Planctomycetota bacterium]